MIKFSVTNALVHSVTPITEIPSKTGGQSFFKRELIIDDSWEKDGKRYPNYVSIEFSGDKLSQLDNIYPGQRVNVEGLLSGREYNNRIFNSVRGQAVTPNQQQYQNYPAPAPMPGGYPQQQQYPQASGYGSQGAYPPPGNYPQQPASPAYNQQQYAQSPTPTQQSYSPGVADLPFKP